MRKQRKNKVLTKGQLSSTLIAGSFALLFFLPLYFFFINAFKEAKFISLEPMLITPESFTLDNIIKAFELLKYPQAFTNSAFVLIISLAGMIILGSMLAFAIAVIGGKVLNRLYFFIVALITLPVYTAIIPLARTLADFNLINTHWGTSMIFIAFSLPVVTFLYVGNIKVIPKELAESATVDGCNYFQTYLYIYMPLLVTVTGTVMILQGMYIWNSILFPMLTVRTGYMQTLPQRLVVLASTNMTRWDVMFGGSFLVSLPIIIVFLLLQKMFIKGIVDGSVKG